MTPPRPPAAGPGRAAGRFAGRSRRHRRAERRRRTWWTAVGVGLAVVVVAGAAVGATAILTGDPEPVASRSRAAAAARPGTTTTATAAALPTGRACRAPLTPDAPLRLWIAGDSIAYSVGNGLGRRAANTGVVAPVYESRVSSGVSSPGFFDWPRRVGEEIPRLDPEVVVFVMGTNDWLVPQPAPLDPSGQPAWRAAYEKQVQALVDALTAGGRTLYWVGPPVLRDPKQEAGAIAVAEVIERVVTRHPDAAYVDAHDLLDGDAGTYTPTINADGRRVVVRAGDGVHLTEEGGEHLGAAIFAQIDAQCRLRDHAVPGARQSVVETKGSTSVPPGATATAPPAPASTTPVPPAPSTAPPATAPAPPTTSGTPPPVPSSPAPTTPPTTGG